MVRHARPEEALANTIKRQAVAIRAANTATGTEKAQTSLVAEQAASDALDAIAAAEAADSLAKGAVTFSTSNPTAGDAAGKPIGALWTVLSSNAIESYWELTSLGWIKRPLSTTVIPQINIGTGTFGVLAGARLAADAIDGKTITGATIRTAASGQRMQFDASGLLSFNAANAVTAALYAGTGGMQLDGTFVASDMQSHGPSQKSFFSPSGSTAIMNNNSADAGFSVAEKWARVGASTGASGDTVAELLSYTGKGLLQLGAGSNEVLLQAESGAPAKLLFTDALEVGSSATQTVKVRSKIEFHNDTSWRRIDATAGVAQIGYLGSGVSHFVGAPYDGLQARIKGGVLYISGAITRSGGYPANHVLFTLNAGFRPGAAAVQYAYVGGHNFVVASQIDGTVIVAVATSGSAMYLGLTIPLT